jgi:hypothetical protein
MYRRCHFCVSLFGVGRKETHFSMSKAGFWAGWKGTIGNTQKDTERTTVTCGVVLDRRQCGVGSVRCESISIAHTRPTLFNPPARPSRLSPHSHAPQTRTPYQIPAPRRPVIHPPLVPHAAHPSLEKRIRSLCIYKRQVRKQDPAPPAVDVRSFGRGGCLAGCVRLRW